MKKNGNGFVVQETPEPPDDDQLNYVHDLLSMISDDLQLVLALDMGEDDLTIIFASRNVLCWVLGHGNASFPDGIQELEDSIKELGHDMLKSH